MFCFTEIVEVIYWYFRTFNGWNAWTQCYG